MTASIPDTFDESLGDAGFVEFAAAGAVAAGEFRCADCGYGVIVHRELPSCPMCGGDVWERTTWGSFRLPPGDPPR